MTEKSKFIKVIPKIICIAVMLLMTVMCFITGRSRQLHNRQTVPVFTGIGFDYSDQKYDTAFTVFVLLSIISGIILLILILSEKKRSLFKKITGTVLTIISGIFLLFLDAFSDTLQEDSFYKNYYPEFYICSDDTGAIRLLFAEGAFLLDGMTKVYCLDEENHAYYLGQFSTDDGAVQGGRYDISYSDDTVSFQYDYGTVDNKGNKVCKTASFRLPEAVLQ